MFLSTLATAACFKACKKFKSKIDIHLKDEWLNQHFSLAAVFSSNILVNGSQIEILILSDTGASISFVSAAFITRHGLQPIGTWIGQIVTLTTTENVRTPFFKLDLVNGESTKQVICLKIEDLGNFNALPSPAYLKFGAFYGVLPSLILSRSGSIDLSMGCDNVAMLLKEVTSVDGHKVVSPDWAPGVKLFKSFMSPKFSILGMIGTPPWIQQASPKANGIFHFYQLGSLQDNLSLLKENKQSYFVTKATHIKSTPLQIKEIGAPFVSNYTA